MANEKNLILVKCFKIHKMFSVMLFMFNAIDLFVVIINGKP